LLGLVLVEQSVEENDGIAEVVVKGDEQVDVVEVFLAAKAMGEVVAWVDGGAHFAAAGAEEAEIALAHFGRWPVTAEGGDGDGHGKVVAQAAQEISVDHGLLVPGQIVVAVVAELTVHGFWGCEGRFAKLLRILEKKRRRLPN
jgi:hypothetical protein